MRRIKIAAVLAVLVGTVFTAGLMNAPSEEQPAAVSVLMEKMAFSPAKVEIKKGDIVEWKNKDITPHTATSPVFGNSGALAYGQSWQHKFTESGTFPYTCTFHPTMRGVVVVK